MPDPETIETPGEDASRVELKATVDALTRRLKAVEDRGDPWGQIRDLRAQLADVTARLDAAAGEAARTPDSPKDAAAVGATSAAATTSAGEIPAPNDAPAKSKAKGFGFFD